MLKAGQRFIGVSPRQALRLNRLIPRTRSPPRTVKSSWDSSAPKVSIPIKVTDTNARATMIHRKQIEQIRPSATSVMPVGLTGALGIDAIRDLIAYFSSAQQPHAGSQSAKMRAAVHQCSFNISSVQFCLVPRSNPNPRIDWPRISRSFPSVPVTVRILSRTIGEL